MKILIWGLGYVGTVSAACLAHLGHEVVGVEPNLAKVQALANGRSAIKEPELDGLVERVVAAGRLRATASGAGLVAWADVSIICVGTPRAPDGSAMLENIRQVALEIGEGIRRAKRYHLVVLRSTVFPGTTRQMLLPLLEERSQRPAGAGFGLVMNPEFMREASAVADFYSPPYTVIGQLDGRCGSLATELYRGIAAPVHVVSVEEAELLKLACNAFHALKIGFANEIGRLSDRLGLDGHTVMRLVCADTKLNISPAYLKPGFAFGGSCLVKDLSCLTSQARRLGAELPLLESITVSNRLQVETTRAKIAALNVRRAAILGLSFKMNTDDLRESPVIDLIESLNRDGIDVAVYDPQVCLDQMLGSNREYVESRLPQIRDILGDSLGKVLEGRDAVVVTQARPEFKAALIDLPGHVAVFDLVRLCEPLRSRENHQDAVMPKPKESYPCVA
jgi:GDP-mannose 6-dehydrogenase